MLRLIIPIGFVAYFLKLTGFCFSEPGYLSDATLILNVLHQEIARGDPAFQDASAYLRQRPDCCEVNRWNSAFMDGHFLNALFGRRFFEVSVRYPVAPEAGSEDPFYNAIYIMDCCGRNVTESARNAM